MVGSHACLCGKSTCDKSIVKLVVNRGKQICRAFPTRYDRWQLFSLIYDDYMYVVRCVVALGCDGMDGDGDKQPHVRPSSF